MRKKELDQQLQLMKVIKKNRLIQQVFEFEVYEYNNNIIWFEKRELENTPVFNMMHEVLKYDVFINNKKYSDITFALKAQPNNFAKLIKTYFPKYGEHEIQVLNSVSPIFLFDIINMIKLGAIEGELVLDTIIQKFDSRFWSVKQDNTRAVVDEVLSWE